MAHKVFDTIHEILKQVEESQLESISAAGKILADCTERGGVIHVFGTGHSHMWQKAIFQSWGLANVNAMLDKRSCCMSAQTSTDVERLEGYARIILSRYQLSSEDVMIVVSNSGRNAVPIEMAMLARERGLAVVVVTALDYSKSQASRHSSRLHLYEVADCILDTRGNPGDAAVEVEGLDQRSGYIYDYRCDGFTGCDLRSGKNPDRTRCNTSNRNQYEQRRSY
jgi:uncharacterized phosphosugar-binding protein